jgi:hypothetical protein
LEKIENNFATGDHTLRMEYNPTSAIKLVSRESAQQMSPHSFQKMLRSKQIVIADYNLPYVSCDRHGLMSLNSFKEIVNIEGAKFYFI